MLLAFEEMTADWKRTKSGNFTACILNHAYPPSITAVSQLNPITLQGLRHETHYVGRVLFARTIANAVRMTSVRTVIEDCNGEVDLLDICYADRNADPAYIFPKNTVFAIREPFYKINPTAICGIRIDHPSDLIQGPATRSLIPIELTFGALSLDQDALAFMQIGNGAWRERRYFAAVQAYTDGLKVCAAEDDSLRYELYRNKAIVNIKLLRHETACSDALAAIVPEPNQEDAALQLNAKAHYQASRGPYCLQDYSAEKAQFEIALSFSPDDKAVEELIAKTELRIQVSRRLARRWLRVDV